MYPTFWEKYAVLSPLVTKSLNVSAFFFRSSEIRAGIARPAPPVGQPGAPDAGRKARSGYFASNRLISSRSTSCDLPGWLDQNVMVFAPDVADEPDPDPAHAVSAASARRRRPPRPPARGILDGSSDSCLSSFSAIP